LHVDNGRAQGEPRLAKENVRAAVPLGLTPAGTLYVYQAASPSYVRVLPFDQKQGKVIESEQPLFQHFIRDRGRPVWSLDGRQLLFWSCAERNWPCTMFIRDGDGLAREVPHGMWYVAGAVLSPDGRSVVANGSDLKDRSGAHLIDVTNGETLRLEAPFGEFSNDGQWIRFTQVQNNETVLLERPINGRDAREVFRTREREVRNIRVSADGKFVGFNQLERAENGIGKYVFTVAELPGGTPRVIAEIPGWANWQWASDNQSVFILEFKNDGQELWRLPLSGTPHKIEVDAKQWTSFHISPDGTKIAFAARAGRPGFEVWALENVVPPAVARK
jgi:Tol biopolymer transport system component